MSTKKSEKTRKNLTRIVPGAAAGRMRGFLVNDFCSDELVIILLA
jgi:hypothetical protein